MATQTVFLFDPVTFLFAGTYEAHESPEEPGKFVAPDHSTPHPVPMLAANEAAVFDVAADAWTVVPDFRGQTFFDQATGAEVVIEAHGAVPAGLAATKPAAIKLEENRKAAIEKTYTDVDGIYALAVGNRAEEYKQAEADARAFKSAGYSGTPSEYISGWATVKGLTNQQSADAIIARADALATTKLSMRNQRFTSQAAMLAAKTQAKLDTAIAEWDTFIVTIKAAL
jgi:hypothetical protein